MEPLTAKQQKVLRFIEGRLKDSGPPSQREIAEHFGLSQNAVCQLVGYLKKGPSWAEAVRGISRQDKAGRGHTCRWQGGGGRADFSRGEC